MIANASRELRSRISLRVETTISAGVFEAKLIDQILFADHRAFRSLLKEVSQSGVKKCIFNLSALTSIDSSGLGMFMVALDEAKKAHWALTIKSPQGHVRSLLVLSRFDKLLNIEAQAGGCLELASAILRAGSAQAIRRPAGDVKEARILIIDDSVAVRRAIDAYLRADGFLNLAHARDGAEALQVVGSWHPDLMIADLTMPNLDGFELCRRVRSDAENSHIPISSRPQSTSRLVAPRRSRPAPPI